MDKKKHINFKAIGLSLIFLFNPNVAVIDILPDFIGYIILCLALVNLADINETIFEALSIFKKMIFIDFAKVIAIMWIFGLSVTNEQNSSLLLWSFVFGVLEIVFVIPAFLKLFKGLTELGYVHENTSVIASIKGKKSKIDKIKNFTVFFLTLKSVLSFLPEFADITSTQYSDNVGITNMYRYIGIMRFLAFIPVLIFGIVWIIKIILYFNRINKDKFFTEKLSDIYKNSILSKKGIFVKRNVLISFVILITALIFSYDLRMENVNMLPDFVCGFLLIAFFTTLSKQTVIKRKLPIALSIIYTAVAVINYIFEIMFFKNYYYSAIYRNEEAMTAFVLMAVSACISIAIFAMLVCFVLKALEEVIAQHTGMDLILNESNLEAKQKISFEIKKENERYLLYCLISTVIYTFTDVCYIFLAKDVRFMLLINTIGAAIFVASFFKAYFAISEAVNSKYILE